MKKEKKSSWGKRKDNKNISKGASRERKMLAG